MGQLISDPISNPAGEAQGFANIASTPFEGQSWMAAEGYLGALSRRNTAMYGETDPETGVSLAAPEPRVPAAELQRQYGVAPGFGVSGLSFTADLPASVASDMHDAKLAEQRRADAAARTPDGLLASVERFGASAATQLLDPLGAAAMMVPIGGEVEGATTLARAGSALLRGGVAGAAVTAPFVALHKAYADAYGEDYSAGDALREILMGGALGGGLHAGFTVAGDLLGRAFRGSPAQAIVDANPDIRHAAASEAVAAALDERPPQSLSVIELGSAFKAQDELSRFAAYQGRLDAESGDVLAQGNAADQASVAADQAADRLSALQEQHAAFQGDIADAQARLDAATDPVTADRLTAIDAELTDATTPAARRDTLVTERDMLTQGARTTLEQDAVAAASAQTELTGLQTAQDRVGRQVDQAQAAADQAALLARQGDRTFRIQSASIEGREAIAQSLAERTLRRLATQLNVDVAPDELAGLARRVLREHLDPREAVVDITGRRAGEAQAMPSVNDGGAADRLRADAHGAATDITASIAKRASDGHMAPADAAAIKAADDAGKRANVPQVVNDSELNDLHDFMTHAEAAGALDADAKAELDSIKADREMTQSLIKALPQAAACLMRGLL